MTKKTKGVEILVNEVFQTLARPYCEDITEDVCLAIENKESWKKRYNGLVADLGENVINRYIGTYTKQFSGLNVDRKVKARRSSLIKFYTKLK
jgi:hypothetical protein